MDNIKFSIITVCYNAEKTIIDTIESVLNQTYQNYEYIIIDGNSTDSTLKIIDSYSQKFGDKLKVISEPDNGIYDAMNKGIKIAQGDIIGIINSDDWYEKDALLNVIENKVDNKYSIYYGIMRTVDFANGKEIRCDINSYEYICERMINHPTVFVSKMVYKDYGIFDCKYRNSADYDLMIRFTRHKDIQFVPIYKIQANFRTGGISSSINALIETMKIKRKNGMMTNMQYIASMVFLYGRKVFGYIII